MEKGHNNVPGIGGVMRKGMSKLLSMNGPRRDYTRGPEAEGSWEAGELATT